MGSWLVDADSPSRRPPSNAHEQRARALVTSGSGFDGALATFSWKSGWVARFVGQRKLSVTADTYTQVLVAEREVDYGALVSAG